MNKNIREYEVPCISGKTNDLFRSQPVYISVPGSKSITNRALLIAALSDGQSALNGAMLSGDSRVFIECLQTLGISVEIIRYEEDTDDLSGNVTLIINGCNGRFPSSARLNVGSAGTAARFLTAALGVSHGTYELDSSEQMRKRPMSSLLDTLSFLGCRISCHGEDGHFPFTLSSDGFKKNSFSVNIDDSSQFLSAMLIASVLSDDDITIEITGTHGMSYVDITRKIMEQFGVTVEKDTAFRIKAGQSYRSGKYDIEPDASAAAYFYAAAAITGIKVCVRGLHFDSMQGDIEFIRVLQKMGCTVSDSDEGIILSPPTDGILHGIDVDMSSFSDQAITLAAIAPFADSPTVIKNIGHIRLQESDRLSGIITELNKLGIRTDNTEDSVTVYPGKPSSGHIDTYEDHRMAMGFSLIGLKTPGIVINDPGCCSKTFENYFDVLDLLIRKISI